MAAPNILFLLTDQQAISTLSCYTRGTCQTPHLDGLASDGLRFDRAYTPIALCTPARASLLSGQYPHRHGAMFNSGCHLPFDEEAFARLGFASYGRALREAGYRVGYTGKWHAGLAPMPADAGFEEGFTLPGYGHADLSEAYQAWLQERGVTPPSSVPEWNAEGDPSFVGNGCGYRRCKAEHTPEAFLAEDTMAMIDRFAADEHPFFVTCNFWGPHAPYLPSEDYAGLYDPQRIEPWANFADDLRDKPIIHRKYRESLFPYAAQQPWSAWSRMVARYFEFATMIDAQIGRILEHLKEIGAYENTMIVFASDHGETCGIHGGAFDKGAMAYEEVYRVPLIVKPADGSNHPGHACDRLVSLLDVTATFMDVAGASLPDADGRSLRPLLQDPAASWRAQLMSEFHGHRMLAGQRILWHDRYKYIMNFADVDELYDLGQDPAELHNRIWDEHWGAVAEDLRERLRHELKHTGDRLGPEWQCFFDHPVTAPPNERWAFSS